jgi:hypothetical protein
MEAYLIFGRRGRIRGRYTFLIALLLLTPLLLLKALLVSS